MTGLISVLWKGGKNGKAGIYHYCLFYPSPLLYVKWDERGVANFLREEDYSTLMQEDYLFARKFGQESYPLFERICRSMENTQN